MLGVLGSWAARGRVSKLQMYLVPCQGVSLRSHPVYLGALRDDLDEDLIDLDDNTNRSE